MKAKLCKSDKGNYILVNPTKGVYDEGYVIGTSRESDAFKLSVKNCLAIEFGCDLDELAEDYYDSLSDTLLFVDEDLKYSKADFKTGFQKALELMSDKKFTEQDMYKMFIYGRSIDTAKKHIKKLEDKPMDEFFNDFIQSLKQTEWDVEICCYVEEDSDSDSFTSPMLTNTGNPKLDENGCLILKRK